jgi:hypothetical protein
MSQTVNNLFSTYKKGAQHRGFAFDLTMYDFERLICQDCFYCGAMPIKRILRYNRRLHRTNLIKWNGIDRLDNTRGYSMDNCVPCCWECNKMKMNMGLEDFFIRISRIYRLHLNPKESE